MAIRKIMFEVSEDAISPSERVFGGIQGEHNATELEFVLSDSLKEKIDEFHQNAVYRFDAYDLLGRMYSTEPSAVTDEPMVFPLENRLTSAGGSIRVYLVISETEEDNTLLDLYSFPAELFLTDLPKANSEGGENTPSLSTLYEAAKSSAEKAVAVANRILNTDIFLTNLREYIVDPTVTLDEIDANSANPVSSAAIATVLGDISTVLDSVIVRQNRIIEGEDI